VPSHNAKLKWNIERSSGGIYLIKEVVMVREYWRWATEEDMQIAKRLWGEIEDYAQGRGYTEDQFYNALLWLLAVGLAWSPEEERKRVIGQLEWGAVSVCCVSGGYKPFYWECGWEVVNMWGYPSR